MTWTIYTAIYELRSPLHIGYHKVGNVQRTRTYIPVRNLWGAVTERLTRSGFDPDGQSRGDYGKIGRWVQDHCAFTCWFVCDARDVPLVPCYTDDGLRYGNLTSAQFERRYLDAHVSTALDPAATTVQTGSLHEVEFIAPAWRDEQGQVHTTRVIGWLFLDNAAGSHLGDQEKWCSWLGRLQMGGERRYGFGQLRLCTFHQGQPADYSFSLTNARPEVDVPASKPLLAHTLAHGIRARGQIEPLVGRETPDSGRFGTRLTQQVSICWTPGSVPEQNVQLRLSPSGIWEIKCPSSSTSS